MAVIGESDLWVIVHSSYELVKIMDGDGQPVQPYYNQFLKFMGTVILMMWLGWKDEVTKNGIKKNVEAAIKKRWVRK